MAFGGKNTNLTLETWLVVGRHKQFNAKFPFSLWNFAWSSRAHFLKEEAIHPNFLLRLVRTWWKVFKTKIFGFAKCKHWEVYDKQHLLLQDQWVLSCYAFHLNTCRTWKEMFSLVNVGRRDQIRRCCKCPPVCTGKKDW